MQIEKVKSSKLARVMECAGSLHFTDLPKSPDSEVAKEGTAFGEMVEYKLLGKKYSTHAKNDFPFDGDMEFFSDEIVAEVKENPLLIGPITCEQRIDWQTSSGIWIKGAYDISFVSDNTLYVDDVKYGWSLVNPENNWQLISYAIGIVIQTGVAYDEIVMRIHQPRPHHEDGTTREWRISYAKLLELKEVIEARMILLAGGEDDLVTSTNCRYCPAAASCPAVSKAYFRSLEEIHNFVQDDISDAELSFQLDLYKRMQDIFKVRKDSLEALALDRLNNNKLVPNYSIKKSYSNRSWSKGIDADYIKMMTNVDITKVEMLSPAQAEKKGVSKTLVAELTKRFEKGSKLERGDTSELGDKIFGNPNA